MARLAKRLGPALLVALVLGTAAYVLKERHLKYHPYRDAFHHGLTNNAWGAYYATTEDRRALREAFAFLEPLPPQQRVTALITWINDNTTGEESWTVRATDILEGRQAACEIHALAVAVLESFGIRARWIAGVKASIGFGYLEAFVDGRWMLFRLRSESPILGTSAWDLYRSTEPSISIRAFYPKPGERLQSHAGDTHVALFPFANVEDHPELEPIFRSDQGIDIEPTALNPYDYVFTFTRHADQGWLKTDEVYSNFRQRQSRLSHRRRHLLARLINTIDRL